MKRYAAEINDGVVTRVLVVAPGKQGDKTINALGLVEQDGVRPGCGWSWDGSTFSRPLNVLDTWDKVRAERDRLLAGSDWTQAADAPVDQSAWASYRQQLRDIPQTFDNPDDVTWPEAP